MDNTTTPDAKLAADKATGRGSFACYLPAIARILMGLMFFVFGLNGFLHFPCQKGPWRSSEG